MNEDFLPATAVTYADAEPNEVLEDDNLLGVVIDHIPAGMTPPDDGTVLVRWGRSTLAWAYTDDLKRIADLFKK